MSPLLRRFFMLSFHLATYPHICSGTLGFVTAHWFALMSQKIAGVTVVIVYSAYSTDIIS